MPILKSQQKEAKSGGTQLVSTTQHTSTQVTTAAAAQLSSDELNWWPVGRVVLAEQASKRALSFKICAISHSH